jgi:hypothetical protein
LILRKLSQIPGEGGTEKGAEILAVIDTQSSESTDTPVSSLITDSGVPVFLLRQLFPGSDLPVLAEAIERAVDIETTVLPHPLPDDRSSLVAVQSWSEMGPGGMAGWPLVKALLRLRMWSGDGWVAADINQQ